MLMTYFNIGLVVIAVLVVAGLIGYARPRRSRDSQSLYTEGLDNLLRGNLQKSYQSFKKVIDADTDHIPTYLKMGQVLREGGAPKKALKLHDSLRVRPDLSNYDKTELYKNLALDYSALRQYDKAIEWAQAILKLDKRNPWSLRHLVKFYGRLGDWIAGGKYLAQWQKITGHEDKRLQAFCRFRQGFARRREDSPETVRPLYQQALKIDSKFAPAHYYLAESYADEAAGHPKSTNTTLVPVDKQLRKEDSEHQDSIEKLLTQAVSHWSAFVELSPQNAFMVLPRVEETLFHLQKFDDVEPFIRQILNKVPDNLDAITSLANFYVRRGELDKAEELLNAIPRDATHGPLVSAIKFKLNYRKDSSRNLMPELDRLVDLIRTNAKEQLSLKTDTTSLMTWLEPGNDPLENLS